MRERLACLALSKRPLQPSTTTTAIQSDDFFSPFNKPCFLSGRLLTDLILPFSTAVGTQTEIHGVLLKYISEDYCSLLAESQNAQQNVIYYVGDKGCISCPVATMYCIKFLLFRANKGSKSCSIQCGWLMVNLDQWSKRVQYIL